MTVLPALSSYASGVSQVPLLGETIGDNFDRTVARCGDREALVDRPSGRRWTDSQLRAEVDARARGPLAGGGVWKRGDGGGEQVNAAPPVWVSDTNVVCRGVICSRTSTVSGPGFAMPAV